MFIKTIKNICKSKNTKINNNNKEEDSYIVFYFDKNSKKIYCNCNFKFHEDLDHEENIKLSEEYALFCYQVFFNEETLGLIENKLKEKQKESTNNLLNYHNVHYFFINMIKKMHMIKDSIPFVRPTQVFSTKAQIIEVNDNE